MKKLLIVVDMQVDFVDGALGTNEAVDIVPMVKNRIEEFKTYGNDIVFTKDTHCDDYLDTQEGKNLPVKHCIKGSRGHNICAVLNKYTKEYKVYEKNTFGCKELAMELLNMKDIYDEIELCGLCTDICVISNALLIKAFLPEMKITVNGAYCAGVTPQSHKNALEAMKSCQINVIE